MIRIAGVHKRFGRREVLRGVTLDVHRGTVTALVGPNGSGKTTLIKVMLGLARADAGLVCIDENPIDPAGQYRRALGFMPQIARFPENLRVRDLFASVNSLRGDTARDEELIDSLNIAAELDKPCGTLSGGTRQKVNAAIAFLFQPRLLILDEPTAGLDPVASRILKAKIRSVRAGGRTVVITSHNLNELEGLADDIAYLCDGCVQFAGSVRELIGGTGQTSLEDAVAVLMQGDGAIAVSRRTDTGAVLSLVSGDSA